MKTEGGTRGAGLRALARSARALAGLACLALMAGGIALAWTQEQEARTEQAAATGSEARDELGRSSPRGTIAGFLSAAREGDWARAGRYLDFSSMERKTRFQGESEVTAAQRAEFAQQLSVVLERHVRLDLAGFSDDPRGDLADNTGANLERIGTVRRTEAPDFDILLSRLEEGGEHIWLFSESTVARVPELYAQRGYGWVEALLPTYFFDIRFLALELWQWIGLLVLVMLASAAGWIAASVLFRGVRTVLRAEAGDLRHAVLEALAGPLRLALAISVYYLGTGLLHLSPSARDFFGTTAEILTLLAITWFLLRCVDIVQSVVAQRLERGGQSAARTLVPMGRRVTKVFVVAIAAVSLLNNLGFSITGILTTLGVGGLAVALAAQKPLENLFGAIAVIIDQPVKVGDFCRIGEHLGTIEDIGLRSTRIRTLERTVLSIPNAEFSNVRLENFTERDRIRMHSTLQFGYDTSPDQLRYLLVELRRMLYAHPRTHPEPCRVRFVNFSAYSLDVDISVYILTTDHSEFLAIKEDIQLRIMDIVDASGAYFAYPSQTLYLGRDPGRDPARTEEAEARVREWREHGSLPLPEFPPEEIRALDDSLPFPEHGSSSPRRAGATGDGREQGARKLR